MRSDQGRSAVDSNVESPASTSLRNSLPQVSLLGVMAILAVLVVGGFASPALIAGPSAHVGPAAPSEVKATPVASAAQSPTVHSAATSAHPLTIAAGGSYLSGFNASEILWVGQSENASVTWNGSTVIPATVNITYGAAAGLGISTGAGCAAVGDWCPANNATQAYNAFWGFGWDNVTFSASTATGTYSLWVWINATCNPTPTSWAPCTSVGKLTVTVEAGPSSAITSAAGQVLTGPFSFQLSFTTTTVSPHDLWQAQAKINVYSLSTVAGVVNTWSSSFDPALDVGFAQTGSALSSPYSYRLSLADLDLPQGMGNLPAGYYYVGVQIEDANGTIYVPYASNSVGFAITQLSVGPAARSSFTAGHPITVSWATEGLSGQTDVNFTVGFPVSGNQLLNVYQAGGFSTGSEIIVPTLAGTYYVNLTLATPSTPTIANVSTWFTVTPQLPPSCPGGYISGGVCIENVTKVQTNNWANTTWVNTTIFTNTTAASSGGTIDGLGPNALGSILMVVGIIVGGIIGIIAGMMMAKPKRMGGGGGMSDMGSTSSTSDKKPDTKDEFS
jgi:hypothetical protein